MHTLDITAVPDSHQISATRTIDAPPELVFRCYTEPDLIAQWLGPRYLTTKVSEFDARHGHG